jgi:photosystem II stability/assembly factor-like uncharacterized protein
LSALCLLLPLAPATAAPQSTAAAATAEAAPDTVGEALGALTLRGIGPALMGGRIADIAVDPRHAATWYVAAGSGGVWKTINAGVTWTPIFEDQPSYSIGCVVLDPSDPDVVWVGTGENVSGRHVGWGDGVYKSRDGGESWQRMGLEASEHIGAIVIDPRDGDVVYVAAEGPLWAGGGERGLYKTTDGGATWERVLYVDDDTGVTDIEFDPRDPDVLYAASYQRRRSVWSLLAGGPGSGIHKSTDGGESWRRLTQGLPKGDMGKIGLAVSPVAPDTVYATIEAQEEAGGFYRSRDRGESWQRRDGYFSGGTGPHYYQEIVASPREAGVVYQMDVFLHVTRDGGGSFSIVGDGRQKHSDNHALWIDPADPGHLLAGTDGGLYESFDDGQRWRHFGNLPISQFYKLALDNAEPFFQILGGAQDLGTLLGPSRTTSAEGVDNRDWWVPLGADGYACAIDRERPELLYVEWQGGRLNRYDRSNDTVIDIQPQPAPGDPPERWNWDSPIALSPHAAGRLYYGSQRLWQSDDRGNSWQPVSGDLTRARNRYELPMSGRVRSIDALYDNGAMSWYSTLTAISESPLAEGLLYTGSDDGLIQVHDPNAGGEDGWRRAARPSGVPELAFVNDVQASLHDPDRVYAAFDAHKMGDYRPLLFVSDDRGASWRSIVGDLPAKHLVWSIAQDHVRPDLLFIGTEFGIFATLDGGSHWHKLAGGMPTIPFRDVEIQRRDDALVGASFGRGFYVLDDYSPLRDIAAGALDGDAYLFPVADAWSYTERIPMQARGKPSQGSDAYSADNPPYGALITYFLSEDRETARDQRRERERELAEQSEDVPFPGWEALSAEELEQPAQLLLTVRDADGRAVRRLTSPAKAGLHRIAWDGRYPAPDPIDFNVPSFRPPWADDPQGRPAPAGRYQVEMALLADGRLQPLGEPRSFELRDLPAAAAAGASATAETADFQATTQELLRVGQGLAEELGRTGDRLRHARQALVQTPAAPPALFAQADALEAELAGLRLRLQGDRVRGRRNEPTEPSVLERIGQVAGGHWDSRQPPTETQRRSLAVAREQLSAVRNELATLLNERLAPFETELEAAGAPWTPGRALPGSEP